MHEGTTKQGEGYRKLWGWFGLSYGRFIALPRILMHEMPDDWQGRMADLLEEFNDEFPGFDEQFRVLRTKQNKLVKWPDWFLNYRYPDHAEIEKLRKSY